MNQSTTPYQPQHQPQGQPVKQWLPIISLLYSASYWGIVWYPLRLFEEAGLNGLWVTLVCYLTALLVSLPWSRRWGDLALRPVAFIVLGIAAGWANLAFILAMLEGTVVRAMLLFYLSPVWTLLMGRWLLHEKISVRMILLMTFAMAGALLMLWDPQLGQPWPSGAADWLALSSGVAFALSNIMIRKLQQEPILLKTQVTWMGCVLVAVAAILLRADPLPDVTGQVYVWAVVLGIAGFLVANLTLQYGVTHMRAQRSAVILLFELVVGGISAALIAHEIMSLQEIVGGCMILLAGYLVAVWGHHETSL